MACKQSGGNCSDFKIGKFKQNIEEFNTIVEIERTKDGFQIERSKFGTSKYKLIWKSDCTCEGILITTSSKISKKHIGRKYNVEIVKTLSPKQYIYKCYVEGIDFVDQDTIVKIN